jgi:hypothetical protein
MLFRSYVLLFVVSVIAIGLVSGSNENYYCASIGVAQAGSVSTTSAGSFAMKIGDGYSKYYFSVDLSGVDNCDFSLYPTVSYHIHTYSVTDANAATTLSCSNTQVRTVPTLQNRCL